jgi:hypothetical protein
MAEIEMQQQQEETQKRKYNKSGIHRKPRAHIKKRTPQYSVKVKRYMTEDYDLGSFVSRQDIVDKLNEIHILPEPITKYMMDDYLNGRCKRNSIMSILDIRKL